MMKNNVTSLVNSYKKEKIKANSHKFLSDFVSATCFCELKKKSNNVTTFLLKFLQLSL